MAIILEAQHYAKQMSTKYYILLLIFSILLFAAGWLFWPKKKHITFQEAVKSIASKKTLPTLPKPAKSKELKILSAQYGAKDKWLDVTEQLQKKSRKTNSLFMPLTISLEILFLDTPNI